MSAMRSPEEVAREIFDEHVHWGQQEWDEPGVVALIRARDAEVAERVRAETRRANTTAVPSRAFVSPWDAEP